MSYKLLIHTIIPAIAILLLQNITVKAQTNEEDTLRYKYPRIWLTVPVVADTSVELPEIKVRPLEDSLVEKSPTGRSLRFFAPTPRYQGNTGNCAAWASAYAARTILEAVKNGWTNKTIINQNAFSPIFQHRLIDSLSGYCVALETSGVVKTIETVGALPVRYKKEVLLADYCTNYRPVPEDLKIAKQYRTATKILWFHGQKVANLNLKVKAVKNSIDNNVPVVIAMFTPKSFETINNSGPEAGLWKPSYFNYDALNRQPVYLPGHAMCVVGYDERKFGGAFEVMNSFGEDFGDKGFVWIKYQDLAIFTYLAVAPLIKNN